jgi:hypothetical protein
MQKPIEGGVSIDRKQSLSMLKIPALNMRGAATRELFNGYMLMFRLVFFLEAPARLKQRASPERASRT